MKLYGFLGTGTGKLGSAVFSTVAGKQIVRQYQPVVSNPSTVAQTNQRARLKLASQLAAALAPVIVIPKNGLVSKRNGFISKNFDSIMANEGVAQVTYENLQLTNGNAGLPAISASRAIESGVSINLGDNAQGSVNRVVYIMYRKNSESLLQFVDSVIASAPGPEGNFPATLRYQEGELVLYAYGMKDLNAAATAKYGNYSVANGEDIARLVLNRTINMSDVQFTQTRGTTMYSGEDVTVVVPEGSARVFVTASGPGSVSGAGVFEIGQEVTVVATPDDGKVFAGWKLNGSERIVSTSAEYTFSLNGQTDLIAMFLSVPVFTEYVIEISSISDQRGTVSMSPSSPILAGTQVTLTATALSGYEFTGWFDSDSEERLSTESVYTFTPVSDMRIYGNFRAVD